MQAARARILLRRPLVWVLLLVLVGGAAGAVAGQLAPSRYKATTHVFLSFTPSSSPRLLTLQDGQRYTQQVVKSFASIATTPLVLRPVIARLGLTTTPAELAHQISASAPGDSVVIGITVTDPSAARSARIANAVSATLVAEAKQLTPSGAAATKLRLAAIDVARASSTTRDMDLIAFIGIGAAAGLLIALVVLLLRSGRPKPPRGSWRLVWVPRSPGEPA